MFFYICVAEAIFWSPAGVCMLLGLIVSEWWFTAGVAYIAFWGGPLTPAMPLQFALACFIKSIVKKVKNRNENSGKSR